MTWLRQFVMTRGVETQVLSALPRKRSGSMALVAQEGPSCVAEAALETP
jgi:hypothetical protein